MTKNIYTPHRTDRFYNENNNEIGRNSLYAKNYYDVQNPERRFYDDSYDAQPVRRYSEDMYEAPVSRAPKQSRVGLVFATIALTLVAVMSVGTIVFFAAKDNNQITSTPTTTVATSNQNAVADAPDQGSVEEATKADIPAVSTSAAAMNVAENCYAGHSIEATAEENVVLVDGERVYMDTKRIAPAGTGNPAHFYANGKTSYGFDWSYSADNGNFVLACNYNFAKQQYDFTFYGTQPGVAHVTVYYNTDDDTQVPVQLALNVDDNLNVTQA